MTGRLATPGRDLHERAARAVADPELQRALANLRIRLFTARDAARSRPDRKADAAGIRREVLSDLDGWLDRLEGSLVRVGVRVHRCATPADARATILGIAAEAGARRVVKSKSMATEEIELNEALEAAGHHVVETDLGEYVVQLAGERPSHMITPAIHKTLEQIRDVLAVEAGDDLPVEREAMTAWVREHMRGEFLAADLGVTGVNFAAADTGTLALVTNEGNGRYCAGWPRVHVAVMAVEKVVPRFADLAVLLPLLTTSATGQPLSNYVQLLTGPRRPGEVDGPEELHLVLLDHGRRRLLGTPYEEMLACIRCGACLNVCPVYRTVGGHAYDAAYTGPMGKVLTPLLDPGGPGDELPFASSLCGACTEACPVGIPLADLLVRLRSDLRDDHLAAPDPAPEGSVGDAPLPARGRSTGKGRAMRAWSRAWSTRAGYRASTAVARVGARVLPGRWRASVPIPGVRSWSRGRDVPLPAPVPFHRRWAARSSGERTW